MQVSGTDQALWLAGFLGEVALSVVLIQRREYARFPVFVAWLILVILCDPILFFVTRFGDTFVYYRVYSITQILDFTLQAGLLAEVAHSVLRPAQPRVSNRFLVILSSVLAVVCLTALIWTFSQDDHSHRLLAMFNGTRKVNFLFAFLRLALFAAIAGFSQMLGVTWRNHVIRLAAGLAFYSAVSLIVQLSISHLPQGNELSFKEEFGLLTHTQVIAYLCALSFWVWSFVQKDAPRREFTPQMQRILVTLSLAARRDRVSLTRSMGHK